MKKIFLFFLSISMHFTYSYSDSDLKIDPLSVNALQEWGLLNGGHFGQNATAFENVWVDHFGASINATGSFLDQWFYHIGLGGIYQFEKPEKINPEWGGTQYKDFFMGPTEAYFLYKSNHPTSLKFQTQFGLFNYKYTSASNLGEYLFRTGPYPTYILTGGYTQINNSSVSLQGLRLGIEPIQNLTLDFFLTTETSIPPLYDFSLTTLAKYSAWDGVLKLSAGFQLKRFIPMHDYQTKIKTVNNSYFVDSGTVYTGKADYYLNQKNFWSRKKTEALNISDTVSANLYDVQVQKLTATLNFLKSKFNDTLTIKPDVSYYTTAGTILTAAVEFNPQKIWSLKSLGKNDLTLYVEIAVLGWKNYPLFYENRLDRIPVMFGFNFPTFKWVDLISIEFEYFNSPWINSYAELGLSNGATPDLPTGREAWSSQATYNDIAMKDNTSWSVLVQKKIGHALTLSAQGARDHVRMPSFQNWFGPGLDPNEALSTSHNWYGMIQCSFGF